MARYLAIDWDAKQLRIVEAAVQRGKITAAGLRVWPAAVFPSPGNAEAAGAFLEERLREADFAAAPVLFAVGRDRLIFRDVRYPDVPPGEVPAIVRFQAMKELNLPAEEAVIDYAETPIPWPAGEKRAVAVALRKDFLAAVEKTCQAAGLKLEAVVPRSFAFLAGVTQFPAESEQPAAFLLPINGGAELCVAQGDKLLFSRTLTAAENGDWLPELRRSLAAFNSQFPRNPVKSLRIAADHSGIANRAADLRIPVREFDPLPGVAADAIAPAERGGFAAVMGLVQAKSANRKAGVNLLDPKQPPPPSNIHKRYALYAAAAALLIALVGGGMYTLAAMDKDTELQQLASDNNSLKKQIEAFGDLEKRMESINRWDSSDVIVLDDLYDLITRFPDMPGIVVDQVHWEPLAQEVQARSTATATAFFNGGRPPGKTALKPIGRLEITATGDSEIALNQLRNALDGDGHWKRERWELDKPGPKQVKVTLAVYPQDPKEYQIVLGEQKNVTAADKKRDDARGPGRRRLPVIGGRP